MGGINLRDKPIAITGASSGIGAATAIACAAAGMPVVIGARRVDKLDAVAAKIRAAGGRCLVVTCDVTKTEDCQRLVDETINAYGSIYAVFANAGYGVAKAFHEMSAQEVRDIFETNFFGTLSTLRPALKSMLGNSGDHKGHLLICSSCLAKMVLPKGGAYGATKAAQNHVGRAMRMELRPLGVQVSTVHPIGTRTEFFETKREQQSGKHGVSGEVENPPGLFMQTPEFVAACIVQCLRKPRPEVWTGLRGALVRLVMAHAMVFPATAEFFLRRTRL
ncbi:MAG: SDR family NAD(P)-dependent oxidoreductase [Pyrinomonadaceae bacterium]|nr:SDR family NAD(P)-dependent oxidoreductase [Phycisphaerales bacterium]